MRIRAGARITYRFVKEYVDALLNSLYGNTINCNCRLIGIGLCSQFRDYFSINRYPTGSDYTLAMTS